MADEGTERYIAGLRERAAWLAGECQKEPVLGEVVTAAHFKRVEAAIDEIAAGNGNAKFPPLYVYVLRAPKRLATLRTALELAKSKMGKRDWTQFAHEVGSDQPVGAITELSVFVATESGGLNPRWQPTADNGKRPDFLLTLGSREAYLEVSVLTQGEFWDGVDRKVEAAGGSHSGSAPDIRTQAHRVAGKVAEKMKQVVPGRLNVLALVFNSGAEHQIARDWGLEIALEDPSTATFDFSPRHHLDSILAVDFRHPTLHISPNCLTPYKLEDHERHLLLAACNPLPFWFPGSTLDEEY
jgi:hypothetical protein